MSMILETKGVDTSSALDPAYTCDLTNESFEISWYNYPKRTKSFAIVFDDPDAPRDFVHMVAYNIPLSRESMPKGLKHVQKLDDGTSFGINDYNELGYDGPCPPSGTHHYRLTVYALDQMTDFPVGLTRAELRRRMEGHIVDIGKATLTYRRH